MKKSIRVGIKNFQHFNCSFIKELLSRTKMFSIFRMEANILIFFSHMCLQSQKVCKEEELRVQKVEQVNPHKFDLMEFLIELID